jgi:aspartyl-tRNA(Asn)/glutamyl-tRNA(Gln) amidotransferase subunit C
MSLSADQARWIAHLARLELNDSEREAMAVQLSSILDYMNQLQQVDTAGVEPLAHPLSIQNVFREDTPAPSLPVDAALSNAPVRRGDFFAVPAVME